MTNSLLEKLMNHTENEQERNPFEGMQKPARRVMTEDENGELVQLQYQGEDVYVWDNMIMHPRLHEYIKENSPKYHFTCCRCSAWNKKNIGEGWQNCVRCDNRYRFDRVMIKEEVENDRH